VPSAPAPAAPRASKRALEALRRRVSGSRLRLKGSRSAPLAHTSTPASVSSARVGRGLRVDSAGYAVPGALARGTGTQQCQAPRVGKRRFDGVRRLNRRHHSLRSAGPGTGDLSKRAQVSRIGRTEERADLGGGGGGGASVGRRVLDQPGQHRGDASLDPLEVVLGWI
jgi:hypothetical protein